MKSYDGCWTCRLRKKRCDEMRPVCRNCSALEITCHFDEQKPLWMDGGSEQRQKAEEVKREVRSAAARRRGTMSLDDLDPVTTRADNDRRLANDALDGQRVSELSQASYVEGADTSPGCSSFSTQPSTESSSSNLQHNSRDRPNSPWTNNLSPDLVKSSELDRRFLMFYFDHFFPFLFPFYRPAVLEGGRSWIMELVVRDQAIYHTTLCLSSYFVSIALDGAASGPNVCKTLAWDKLLEQMGTTFTMLQHNIQSMASENTRGSMVEKARVMGSIIQLQRFEISVANFENCRKHLDAATALFEQIFRDTGNEKHWEGFPTLHDVLSHIGQPIWDTRSRPSRAWSSDQAAFRFYSALLIVDDIIASTCLGKAPSLLDHHARLLLNNGCPGARPPIDLEDFTGCENWVMLQIGEIATLDSWKKSRKKAGQLDMMELVARASTIKHALLCGLTRLDAGTNKPKDNARGLFPFYDDSLPVISGGHTTFVTRVWAHAALLYLSVTVSGWQPVSVEIRENVARILTLLDFIPDHQLLRTMTWPFCIAGCLAEPPEEHRFRAMADALVPHRLFGPARKALEVMENAWKCRDDLSIYTDFAACVRSLGSIPLLV